MGQQGLHCFGGCLGVLAALGHLLQAFEAFFHALQVGQQKFRLNGVHVTQGINAAVNVRDVFILKAAHHMHDGRAFADVAQKLVAKAFALAGSPHKTGNVDEVHAGIDGFLRFGLVCQVAQPRVRHGHRSLVRLDGAEGVVGGLGVLGLGEGIEKSGLAHVGQTDDTYAEGHAFS